jgi:hypothetical protein
MVSMVSMVSMVLGPLCRTAGLVVTEKTYFPCTCVGVDVGVSERGEGEVYMS